MTVNFCSDVSQGDKGTASLNYFKKELWGILYTMKTSFKNEGNYKYFQIYKTWKNSPQADLHCKKQ